MAEMTEEDRKLVEQFRPRIERELSELEALRASSAADRKAVELDQQSVGRLSRMDAMRAQAMATANEISRQLQAARLKQALQRMEDGEFGYCTTCGDRIADGRLTFDATVHLCVSCARLRGY